MQILSSSFPTGAPGGGLLLLRFAVAGALMTESSGRPMPIVIAAALVAFSVTIGFLSIIVALLATLMQAGLAFAGATGLVAVLIPQSLALTLLGPGAYSVDARLFGRRLIFESREPHGPD